jgi:hypothetical protein
MKEQTGRLPQIRYWLQYSEGKKKLLHQMMAAEGRMKSNGMVPATIGAIKKFQILFGNLERGRCRIQQERVRQLCVRNWVNKIYLLQH